MTEANRLYTRPCFCITVDLFETSCILQAAHKAIRQACLGHGFRVGLNIQGHFNMIQTVQMQLHVQLHCERNCLLI